MSKIKLKFLILQFFLSPSTAWVAWVECTSLVLGVSKLSYLDFQITSSDVETLLEKRAVLKLFPLPVTVDKLRRILEMINFYHRFMPGASGIQASLYDLVHGKKKKEYGLQIEWTEEKIRCFESSVVMH